MENEGGTGAVAAVVDLSGVVGEVAAKMTSREGGPSVDGDWPKSVTLSDGRVATVRRGKGRDIRNAGRTVDMGKDGPLALQMACCAIKTSIDGKPLTVDDLYDMWDQDVWELMGAASGKGQSSPPSTSSR